MEEKDEARPVGQKRVTTMKNLMRIMGVTTTLRQKDLQVMVDGFQIIAVQQHERVVELTKQVAIKEEK